MTLLYTILAITGLMVIWVGVQHLWRRTFADYIEDDDVLAERRSCGNCGCQQACPRKRESLETKAAPIYFEQLKS
jgi:hypothetical protein